MEQAHTHHPLRQESSTLLLCSPFQPLSSLSPFRKGQEVEPEESFCPSDSLGRAQESRPELHPGSSLSSQDPSQDVEHFQAVRQQLTSVTVLPSDPRPLPVLLLCAHLVSHLAGATPPPQATTAFIGSSGITKDPCPSGLPTAKQCPAMEVTWPELEVPLSKEQF